MGGALLKPDYSLIQDWQKAQEEAPNQFEEPFVAQFKQGDTQLHYIAACHGGDIDSATLKTLKEEFENFSPDIVVVEGIPNTGEKSPAWYLEYAQEQEKSKFSASGEGTYAAVLAAQRHIDFVPGEPTAHELFEGMSRQGFTTEDMLGWHVAGMIKSRFNKGDIDDTNAAALIEQSAKSRMNELGLKETKFDLDDFRHWYQERMGKDFSLSGVAADDGSPSSDENANFLQKMMAAADKVREPHIVENITRQLAENKKVLVIYGAAHLKKQEQVFKKMMGNPTYSKPFSDDITNPTKPSVVGDRPQAPALT